MNISSIKFKMTLAVFLMTFILMLTAAIASLYYFEANFKQNMRQQQFALLHSVSTQIDEKFFDAIVELDTMADTIKPGMLAHPKQTQDLVDTWSGRLKFFDNSLMLFSRSGKLLAASPREMNLIGKDYSFRPYFKETMATERISISDNFPSIQKSSHPIVMFTTPVYDVNNKVIAVLGGTIDLSKQKYLQSLTHLKFGREGYFSLYDLSRSVLMHPDRSRLFQQDPVGANRLIEKALAGFEGTEETRTRNGSPVLRSVMRLKSTGWVLSVSYPLTDAYAPIYRFRTYFLASTIAAALISLLIVWPLIRYLTKPLLSFTSHLERFKVMEEVQPLVQIRCKDEIGILAQTFNRMVLELRQRSTEVKKQKEFAESLVLSSALPTFVVNSQHRVLIWNKACEEYTGIKAADIIGTDRQSSAFHRGTRSSLADVIIDGSQDFSPLLHLRSEPSKLVHGGWHCEGWCEAPEGVTKYLLIDAAPIRNDSGELIAAIETVRDITEFKKAEQALERSRDFHLTLFENFPAMIWRSGTDARCNYFNQTWLDFTGRTWEQEMGDGWAEGVHPEDLDRCLAIYLNAFHTRKPFEMRYRLRRHDLQYRWIMDIGRPFDDLEGNFAGYLGACYDVTEQQEAANKIIKLSRVIEQNPDSIVIATLAGAIEYANPKTAEATGYSLEELLGQDIKPLAPSEAWGEIERALHEVVTDGKDWRGEILSKRRDCEEILYEEVSISPIKSPEGRPTHFVITKKDISERKRFQLSLQESEERYRQLFENNPQPMWAYDQATLAFLAVNDAAVKHYGYSRQEFLARTLSDILRKDDLPAFRAAIAGLRDSAPQIAVWQHIKKDGSLILVEMTCCVIPLCGRDARISVVNDLTERVQAEKEKSTLEHQLRQSQKMEAIGTLAGGIAHDFNNILTAIVGYATLMQMKMGPDALMQRKVKQILAASERAAKLTQSLLSYSRKQVTALVPVELNSIINKSKVLLRRLVTEDIHFDFLLTGEDLTIMADTGQIEQVLMNLVVNARDAMHHGGQLCIATESVRLDQEFIAAHGYGIAGDYALLTVTDSGVGMDAHTRDRIFEPFFTTKDVDKGTGLGLAVAYGIIQQHSGYINCCSEPEHGTIFRIYLPLTDTPRQQMVETVVPDAAGGRETILLVEDDAELRNIVRELLEDYGYTVITAVNGEDAVLKFTEFRETVQIVILDVIMPKMNGKDAYEKITALSRSVKVLFMSGYPRDIVTSKSLLDGYFFMPKPLKAEVFLNKVREVLDSTELPV